MTRYEGSIAFDIVSRDAESARAVMPVTPGVLNPFGTVHAGAMLWFADVTATTLALEGRELAPGMSGFPLAVNLNAHLREPVSRLFAAALARKKLGYQAQCAGNSGSISKHCNAVDGPHENLGAAPNPKGRRLFSRISALLVAHTLSILSAPRALNCAKTAVGATANNFETGSMHRPSIVLPAPRRARANPRPRGNTAARHAA
jgi:hypothetical protein